MPRKAQPNSRTKLVSARYSNAEHLAIKRYAESLGIGMSTFIYKCVMSELERNNAPTSVYTDNPNQLSITDKVDSCKA